MEDEKYQKILNYALKLLSFRPRSQKELFEKLKHYADKKKIPKAIIDMVIDYLKEQNFLNDEEFARWWFAQRISFRPKGFQLIKLELMKKGVDKETIEHLFSDFKNKEEDEFFFAMKVLEKKKSLLQNLKRDEIKAKIMRLLGTRGFSWEVIYRTIDDFLKKA